MVSLDDDWEIPPPSAKAPLPPNAIRMDDDDDTRISDLTGTAR